MATKIIRTSGPFDRRTQPVSPRWWLQEPDEAAKSISQNISFWSGANQWRMSELNRLARLYGNLSQLGFPGLSMAMQSTLRSTYGDQISLNVGQSAVDTLTAKMARNRPKPYFLSNDGDYKAQRLAKNRNKFLSGVFYENQTFQLLRILFRDSAVWGDGITYVHEESGRVKHTRILPAELFCDEVEALTEDPRQIHWIRFLDKDVAAEMWPEHAMYIQQDHWTDGQTFQFNTSLANLICVRFSWHLPSGPDATDGAFIVTIGERALTTMTPYTRDQFPFVRLPYTPRIYGWWSQGLIEQGQTIQYELNRVAGTIQMSQIMGGSQKIYLPNDCQISADHINDAVMTIIRGSTPPSYMTPPLVQPEIYAERERLIARYYQLAGISQADASSSKPSGELSGEAVRLIHDIGTERFVSQAQQLEECVCQIAKLSIWVAQDIVEKKKGDAADDAARKKVGYKVGVPYRGAMLEVDFRDLKFERDEAFYLECFPVSLLPTTPEGRTQYAMDMAAAGWIDPDTARDLVDFPDTGRVEGLHAAKREFYTKMLDEMVDDAKPYTPEAAYDDPAMLLELALEYYHNSRRISVPEQQLQLLRDLIDQTKVLIPPPPAIPGPAPVPPANPMPTPTSPLIPNVNH